MCRARRETAFRVPLPGRDLRADQVTEARGFLQRQFRAETAAP